MAIIINLNDYDILAGGKEIEYGYGKGGVVYSKYGANPPMKDPYSIGFKLIDKTTILDFDETVPVEAGYFILTMVGKGGKGGTGSTTYHTSGGGGGSGGCYRAIVYLQKGQYRFVCNSGRCEMKSPRGESLIVCNQGGIGKSSYKNKVGEQGSGGTVVVTESTYLTPIKYHAYGKLGGIANYSSGKMAMNSSYFNEEIGSAGKGGNGTQNTGYNGEDGIVRLEYYGKYNGLMAGDLVLGAWSNHNSANSYEIELPKGYYRFNGISEGGYGGYNTNGYNTYRGGGGSSGYHLDVYLQLEGKCKIQISDEIYFSINDENLFVLKKGNGGGYGSGKYNYPAGEATTMTEGALSKYLIKTNKSESIAGTGTGGGNLSINILGQPCGVGSSAARNSSENWIRYSTSGDSGFELFYLGKEIPE